MSDEVEERVVWEVERGRLGVMFSGPLEVGECREVVPAASLDTALEALYSAEEFIVTVQKWMGGPDDQHEALDQIRSTLAQLDPTQEER